MPIAYADFMLYTVPYLAGHSGFFKPEATGKQVVDAFLAFRDALIDAGEVGLPADWTPYVWEEIFPTVMEYAIYGLPLDGSMTGAQMRERVRDLMGALVESGLLTRELLHGHLQTIVRDGNGLIYTPPDPGPTLSLYFTDDFDDPAEQMVGTVWTFRAQADEIAAGNNFNNGDPFIAVTGMVDGSCLASSIPFEATQDGTFHVIATCPGLDPQVFEVTRAS